MELLFRFTKTAHGSLLINPKLNVNRVPELAMVTPSSLLARIVIEKNLSGYNIIRAQAKVRTSPRDPERVVQASSQLIALEIIEETRSKIVMQFFWEPSTFPPQKILRREHYMVSRIQNYATNAHLERDLQLAKNVIARDIEVDRLYFFWKHSLNEYSKFGSWRRT